MMTENEDKQLRAATWARIIIVLKQLSEIPGVHGARVMIAYGTGEPDVNADYNPGVLTIGKSGFGDMGIGGQTREEWLAEPMKGMFK